MALWRRFPLGKIVFVSLVIGTVAVYAVGRARTARPYQVHRISSALNALALDGERTIGVHSPGAMHVAVYSSYTCRFCRDWWTELDSLIESRASLVVHIKHLVPPSVIDMSYQAALAAECAGDQGVFHEYHDLLFKSERIDNERLWNIAGEAGVADHAQFRRCMATNQHQSDILRHVRESAVLGITGTPGTVVSDRVILGTFPIPKLMEWGR